MARIDEIAPEIFRISIFVPQAGMQFNQFLIKDDEPLLFTTGLKGFFPEMQEAVSRLIDPTQLRWIGFSHFESDECGSLNQWLEAAPRSEAVTGFVGGMVSINDFALRPARMLQHNEALRIGKKQLRYISTPHVPHGWDAGLFYEETDRTLLTSDLFHHNGDVEPLTQSSLTDRCRDTLIGFEQGPLAGYIPYNSKTDRILHGLAELQPKTLAIMHGSSFSGDGKQAIEELAVVWREVLGE
jgi:flavorubredoxin